MRNYIVKNSFENGSNPQKLISNLVRLSLDQALGRGSLDGVFVDEPS